MTNIDFEFVRIMIGSCMFACACYFDIKKREVSDLLWIAFGAMAGVLYIFDFPSDATEGIYILTSMGLASAVGYGIYRAGLFGGADMLALIVFSGVLPLTPDNTMIGIPSAIFHKFAPLSMLTNAIILSLSYVVINVVRNLIYR